MVPGQDPRLSTPTPDPLTKWYHLGKEDQGDAGSAPVVSVQARAGE